MHLIDIVHHCSTIFQGLEVGGVLRGACQPKQHCFYFCQCSIKPSPSPQPKKQGEKNGGKALERPVYWAIGSWVGFWSCIQRKDWARLPAWDMKKCLQSWPGNNLPYGSEAIRYPWTQAKVFHNPLAQGFQEVTHISSHLRQDTLRKSAMRTIC